MKKLLSLFVVMLSTLLMVGCNDLLSKTPTITVDDNIEVLVNDSITITPVLSDFVGTPILDYSSADNSIFTVDNGVISGISLGSAKLTIKAEDTNVSITVDVNVVSELSNPVLELSFANTDFNVIVEEHLQLQLLANNSPITDDVTWESSNECIGFVNATGLFTAIASGKTTITATLGLSQKSVEITVVDKETAPVVTSLTIEGPDEVIINQTIDLSATPNIDLPISINWASSNNGIAIVSQTGVVTGITKGSVTIVASTTDNEIIASKKITVTLPPITNELTITANPGPSLYVGDTGYFLLVNNSNGGVISRSNCTFSSSDTNIAKVNSYGTITPISAGTVVITVTYGDAKGTITLDVKDNSSIANLRNKIVSIAIGELGYHEGTNNNTKYGIWYGMNMQPWCAMFVSWSANQAGISTTIIPKYASVLLGMQWFQNKGSNYFKSIAQVINGEYTPICGDIVFFKSNGASHTGIVIKVVGDKMYTIEGNTSDQVAMHWYYYKTYDKTTGFGVPAYPTSSEQIYDFDLAAATFGGGSSTT